MSWVANSNTHCIDLESSSNQDLSRLNTAGVFDLTTGTVEFWIKLESLSSGLGHDQYALSTTVDVGLGGFFVEFDAATDKIKCGFGGTAKITQAGTAFATGAYHHVAFAWDTSGSELIIDGSSDNTGTAATLTAGGTFSIGVDRASTGTKYTDGKIDDVRIWNTKRTATQVNTNKSIQLVGTESGLLSYWALDNDLLDKTSGARTLTNNGAAAFATDPAFSYAIYTNTALADTAGAPTEALTLATSVSFTLSDTAGSPTESITFKRGWSTTSKSSASWNNTSKS